MQFDFYKYYKLKLKKDIYKSGGKIGLKKCDTKYLNAIIQCLAHTLPLSDYLLTDKSPTIRKHSQNVLSFNIFVKILEKLWNDSMIKHVTGIDKVIVNPTPFEPIEVLLYILSFIHDTTKSSMEYKISGTIKTESDKLIQKSYESWINEYKNDYSFIIDIFYGQAIDSLPNPIFIPFNCLFVENTTTMSLESELEKMYSGKLWKLPNILIINLINFVPFQFEMNLKNLVSKEKCDDNEYIYSLYSINYSDTSSCKDLITRTETDTDTDIEVDTWYSYDNEEVTLVYDNTQLVNNDAKILFYHRIFIHSQVYVLLLDSKKYFVGFSEHLVNKDKILDHNYYDWTREYKPEKIISVYNGTLNDTNKKTLEMMKKHGIENVRGGKWNSIELASDFYEKYLK